MTMTLLQPSSSAAATALTAINSMGTTRASVNAQETDIKKKGKQLHLEDIKQDRTAADLANSPLSSSTALMKPDIGILSKDFLKNKGQGEQSVHKQFTIHRKKQVAAADVVDVGILSNGRRRGGHWRQAFDTNLHAKNKVTGRSLQSEEEIPLMCPNKYGYPGDIGNLFNQTFGDNVFLSDGYFPKCSCPSPTTCGPVLCECLELDADGDILQCMDPFNQLCEGTKYIEGIPGPWSMEECVGDKRRTIRYCSMLPCFVDGSSISQCGCKYYDSLCTEYRYAVVCARSKCCQAQTDDEGREACLPFGGLHQNYYDQVISFSISDEEMISRFNECSFNSDSGKSIVQCYCESFSYGLCVRQGIAFPDTCEAMNCCFGETEDDARLDCFSRFRDFWTGYDFYWSRDAIQESCVASGKSSDQCKCDIQGLSSCVGVEYYPREPHCDLFQCCQSQTDDNDEDEGRKDCFLQDEAQFMYGECLRDGNSTESCACEKSNMLCSSGHSNDLHCELSNCCREQSDDTGREECIAMGTPNSSSSSLLGPKKLRKALVAAVIGWILLT